ncbi:MAG: endonuclease/exonuclease/phosphatase (EEP) superfamily protein YafD [Gammaproteobacteria bacterium]
MKLTSLTRVIELLGWLATASAGVLLLTQSVGWNGSTLLATLHALTPFILAVTIPVAGIACWRKRHALAITTSFVGLGSLLLALPLVFTLDRPAPDPLGTEVSVAAVNLLFSNPVVLEAANDLQVRDADAILFSEYTPEHRSALSAHPIAAAYAYKIEREGWFAGGVALWSKYPIVEGRRPATMNYSLNILMDGPDGPIRIYGVHPPTPIFAFERWVSDLESFGELGSAATEPTLIAGDFNASYWHPVFRDILGHGLSDAHTVHGQGFSNSWPTDKFFPPFVRLDHALTGNGLVSTSIQDFTLPGSDHLGFVVSVVPAR